MSELPKPNTQALSWFYNEFTNKTLRLKPEYQRNPIWSIGQKCFLIDSLIAACPIPQVFVNVVSEGSGPSRKTYYDVVDGQQRLRAIIEFMQDKYPLVATTVSSYPVSDEYKPYVGMRFSDLPTVIQDSIWDYSLAVQELRGWDKKQIHGLFRRLNYVVEKLNKQELRHSQYFGEFVDAVESLANDLFWEEYEFFTRRDYQRMRDIEFVSELFVLLIDGPQDQQKTLDSFYAKYDVEFPKKKRYMQQFRRVIEPLDTLGTLFSETRFRKKADFYALFGAVAGLPNAKSNPIDLSGTQSRLKRIDAGMRSESQPPSKVVALYKGTVIEGPNKLPKRNRRIEILSSILNDALGKD